MKISTWEIGVYDPQIGKQLFILKTINCNMYAANAIAGFFDALLKSEKTLKPGHIITAKEILI